MSFVKATLSELRSKVTWAKGLLAPYVSNPFVLCVDSKSVNSVAMVLAAGEMSANCVLLPTTRMALQAMVTRHTGIDLVLDVDAAGKNLVPIGRPSPAREPKPLPWLTHPAVGGVGPGKGLVVMLTSASTGPPKLVLYTWESVWLQARETAYRIYRESSTMICSTPVAHAYNMNGLFAAYLGRATVCLAHDAPTVASCIQSLPEPSERHTNVLFASPPLYSQLVSMKVTPWTVDQAYSAGSQLSLELSRSFYKQYGVHLRQNYGTSETGNIALWGTDNKGISRGGQYKDHPGYKGVAWGEVSLRRPSSGTLLRTDEFGVPEKGEVCAHMPWSSVGYIRHLDLIPHDHWHPTGDAGHLIEEKCADPRTGAPYTVTHVFAGRRLRDPAPIHHHGLTVLLQIDELESLYSGLLSDLLPPELSRFTVAVTCTPQYREGAQIKRNGLHLHMAVGEWAGDGEWEEKRKELQGVLYRNLAAKLNEKGQPYAVPRSLTLYRELPASTAGKILYGQMVPDIPEKIDLDE